MAKEKIKFLKVREVSSPKRAYPFDAGIDFFVPKFTKKFLEDLKSKNSKLFPDTSENTNHFNTSLTITGTGGCVSYNLNEPIAGPIKFDEKKGQPYFILPPHSRVLIPSGIHCRMAQPGRALIAANKSGVATKDGLVFSAQVVDYTYKGEVHIGIINTGTDCVRIYEDMKLIQFVETPVFNNEVDTIEIDPNSSEQSKEANLKEFYEGLQDDRGAGGFGSTNKK
ncbi:MAG: hypothetical protein GYA51_13905 [Candidatus Methanofastidiosa archaeon]|nr:hypothetical protein [Candidatus Methanofastidiosa archaeon]